MLLFVMHTLGRPVQTSLVALHENFCQIVHRAEIWLPFFRKVCYNKKTRCMKGAGPMSDTRRGKIFRGLFVAIMLAVCVLLACFSVDQVRLRAQIADLTLSLETSRGREARQNHEYDEAVAALPLVQEELARIAPLAEEAKALETDLRQQRKDIRAENAALQERIDEAQATLDELMAQAAALQEAAASIQTILNGQ